MNEALPYEIYVEVKGNNANIIHAPVLTSGTVGLPVRFQFDEAWDNLTKVAVFRAGDKTVDRMDIGSETTVPHEVLQSKHCQLLVGVFGINQEGSVVIPTVYACAGVIQPGADPSGDESADPSAPVWKNALMKDSAKSVSQRANAVGVGCFAGAKAYQIIAKAADSSVAGADGYYVLAADAVPEEDLIKLDYSVTMINTYESVGSIRKVGQLESGLSGIDADGNHVTGLTGFKVYVSGYKADALADNTDERNWNETRNTFRIPTLPLLGNKDFGMGAWAEGYENKAIGTAAHAEGRENNAREMAHAEGLKNHAIGVGSHVEGTYNRAYSDFSHVGGVGNQSFFRYQTVIGTYNQNKEDTLFEVGVGDVATAERANGFEVKKDGSARVLTESTDPNAVVKYSQLESVAAKVGYIEPSADSYTWYDLSNGGETAPKMVTLKEMDFESGALNGMPTGWVQSEATPLNTDADKRYYFSKLVKNPELEQGKNTSAKVFQFSNYKNGDCLLDYKLEKSIATAVLEYKVYLKQTSTSYNAVLPTMFYEGKADGNSASDQPTPLMLFVQQVGNTPVLTFSYGAPAYDKAADLNWDTWYHFRIEYDAKTHKANLYVDGQQISLHATNAYNKDPYAGVEMKLDRIVAGTYNNGITQLFIDDVTITYEDKDPTNAIGLLTKKTDGEKQYIYPVTKPEAVEGLADYIVAEGTSDIWTYRKWASGLAECWCSREYTMDITTACGGVYRSNSITGVELFPFAFADTPICFGQVHNNNGTVWICSCMTPATVFTPQYQLFAPTKISNMTVTVGHYAVGNWK